jgi:hypothetical protein
VCHKKEILERQAGPIECDCADKLDLSSRGQSFSIKRWERFHATFSSIFWIDPIAIYQIHTKLIILNSLRLERESDKQAEMMREFRDLNLK